MTLSAASAICGFAVKTLRNKAKNSEFIASKPRGNRGGWEISERELADWMKRNRIKRGNLAMQNCSARGLNVTE